MAAAKKATIKARIEKWITPTWRFQKRSGATTAAEHTARKALLNRLVEMGQLDTIRMLERDEVTWEELRQADRGKRLGNDHLGADIALSKRLWQQDEQGHDVGVLATMLPKLGSPGNDGLQSRRRFGLALDYLKKYGPAAGLKPTATVKDLAVMDWEAFFAEMGHLSKSTRNGVRVTTSLLLSKYLGSKHHPHRHAVCRVMGPKEQDRAKPKVLTLESFALFFAALDDTMKPIAWVLATSGIRISEYLQLAAAHIRHLPAIEVPGYAEPAAVPNTPESIALARQAIPCPLPGEVFEPGQYPGVGEDWRYEQIRRAFVKASEGAGLERITPHTLRHFYAQTAISRKGGAQSTLQVQHGLRHATADMTSVYTRLDNVLEVADAVGAVLAPLLGAGAGAARCTTCPTCGGPWAAAVSA